MMENTFTRGHQYTAPSTLSLSNMLVAIFCTEFIVIYYRIF